MQRAGGAAKLKMNVSDSRALIPSPPTESSPLKSLPLPRLEASTKFMSPSKDPIRQSMDSARPTSACVDVPPRAPLRTWHPSLNEGRRHSKSHNGILSTRIAAPFRDAWEERSLKLQIRENARQRSSADTCYSRGPEVWKALAELKTRSHL